MATAELRKRILDADDIPSETVTVPEWGDVKLLVKGLTGRQRAQLFKRATGPDDKVDMERWMLELVMYTVYDPDTAELIFEPANRDALAQKSGAAIQRLHDTAARLSGLGDRAVEEVQADFGVTPSGDST